MIFCVGAQTPMAHEWGNIAEVVLLLRVKLLGNWGIPN
jgi:hypothetical protein